MEKEELKHLRGNYSIEEMADMLSVSPEEVADWERTGKINDEKLIELKEIYEEDTKLYVDYIARMEELKKGNYKGLRIWYRIPYPLFVLIAYIILGFIIDGWHPYWVLFITIPVYYSLGNSIFKKNLSIISIPCLIIVAYMLLGFLFNVWSPAWILFVTIPLYYEIRNSVASRRISYLAYANTILLIYLVLGVIYGLWHPWWVLFLSILTYCDILRSISHRTPWCMNIFPIAIIAYIFMGVFGNLWYWGLIVLLSIPIYQVTKFLVLRQKRNKTLKK